MDAELGGQVLDFDPAIESIRGAIAWILSTGTRRLVTAIVAAAAAVWLLTVDMAAIGTLPQLDEMTATAYFVIILGPVLAWASGSVVVRVASSKRLALMAAAAASLLLLPVYVRVGRTWDEVGPHLSDWTVLAVPFYSGLSVLAYVGPFIVCLLRREFLIGLFGLATIAAMFVGRFM